MLALPSGIDGGTNSGMNALLNGFIPEFVEKLAPLAIRQFWQVTVLILVVGLATRWLAKRRPHLAYGLWMIVLIKCLTPPLWSHPAGLFCWGGSGQQAAVEPLPLASGRGDSAAAASLPRRFDRSSSQRPYDTSHPVAANTSTLVQGGREVAVGMQSSMFVGVWLVGAVGFLMLGAAQSHRLRRRLLHHAAEAPADVVDCMENLRRRIGVRRRVRVLIVRENRGPLVLGLFRPTIVLPRMLIDPRKRVTSLEPILAHELIHVRRGDMWTSLLQLAAGAVWWFHPLVWWAQRQANRVCEQCCDEESISALHCTARDYVRCLVKLLELRRRLRFTPPLAGARAAEVTSKRLENLMRSTHVFSSKTPKWCWAVTALIACFVLPGAVFLPGAGQAQDPKPAKPEKPGKTAETAETEKANPQEIRNAADQAFGHQNWNDAVTNYRKLTTINPQDGRSWFRLGYALHANGQVEEALKVHMKAAEFPRAKPVASYNAACALTLLGKKDQALDMLKKAIDAGFRSSTGLEKDPDFADIKDTARFRELAERAKPPNAQGVYRQFDFWVGRWNVYNSQGAQVGTNVISKAERGFLITEKWTNSQGATGTSMNYFDPSDRKWKQTWIGGGGQIVRYEGQFENGKMRMQGEAILSGGRKGLSRMTLTPGGDGTVRQFIEQSTDGGETWTTFFDGVYRPQQAQG